MDEAAHKILVKGSQPKHAKTRKIKKMRQRVIDLFFSEKGKLADQMTNTSDFIYCMIHKTVFAGYSRAYRRIFAFSANALSRD